MFIYSFYIYINVYVHICAKGEESCSLVCFTKWLHFFINKTRFIHTQAGKNKVSFPNPAAFVTGFPTSCASGIEVVTSLWSVPHLFQGKQHANLYKQHLSQGPFINQTLICYCFGIYECVCETMWAGCGRRTIKTNSSSGDGLCYLWKLGAQSCHLISC